MDVVGSNDDLSDYKVVVAPMLYLLQPETAEKSAEICEKRWSEPLILPDMWIKIQLSWQFSRRKSCSGN